MNTVALALVLATAAGPSPAALTVAHEEGHVLYAKRCPGRWVFSYFDGTRQQQPCIGSSEAVSMNRFLRTARSGLCQMQIRVNHGLVENGVLLATDIEQVWDCESRFFPSRIPFAR